MPIGGLVLTLDPDPALRESILAALTADPRLTLGQPLGVRLPMVAETLTLDDGDALVRELSAAPGVLFVDVVSVDFSDREGEEPHGQT